MRLLRLFYTLPLRCRSLFLRNRVEQDLEDELGDHVQRRIDADVARGIPPADARYAAMRAFAGIEQRKEECRDMRHVSFVEHRIQDLRFAVRQLLKHRAFASTAVVVLTLGIAASVAIFGFVDAALVRPLPYREPSRLVTVFGTRPEHAQTQNRGPISYLTFLDVRTRSRAFESIAAYDVRAGFILSSSEGPQRVRGSRVTSGFFRTLGVRPVLGREFQPDEEGPSAPPTVMLSYSAWQSRFGGSADVLERTITLRSPWLRDAEPHAVIGVLPRDFHFSMAEHAEFWATIRGPQACWDVRSCQSLETVARLAAGVSPQTAAAHVTSVLEQLRKEYPEHHRDPAVARLVPLRQVMFGDVRPFLLMLLGGAGLLLSIACINVVSLLLARSDSRAREMAVRNALGASSARIVLQLATEAVVLSATGAVLGLMLAAWGIWSLTSLLSADMLNRMPYLQGIGLSPRLVAFASAVSLIAALVFTCTPLLRLSTSNAFAGLKDGTRGAGGTSWRRFGAHLVVAELALAVLLLVGAGLLGKSLYRLIGVDTGFNIHALAAVTVTPARIQSGAASEAIEDRPGVLARRVAERVAALPGIQSVGYADLLPLGAGLAPSSTFWVVGRPEADQLKDSWPVRRISAGYFRTLEAALMRGREFSEDEVSSARPVMIVNETAARRYFGDEDPIGGSIAFGSSASPAREIVGIVSDIKDGPPETPPHPSAYVPFDQPEFGLVIRSAEPGHTPLTTLATAIHDIQPDALVGRMSTMTERIDRLPSMSLHRSSAWLVGGFAAMAFVLSVVGLYGVVTYSVGQRTREIGVRMALGAERRSVYRLVLGEAAWLVGLGAVLGVISAVIAATLMRHLLFGVRSWDPPTLVAAVVLLTVSALVASYVPARRAASVNPTDVLRAE